MSRDILPNYFKTADIIERALMLAHKDLHAQAQAELMSALEPEDLLAEPELQQSIDIAMTELKNGSPKDAIEHLEHCQAQVTALLPRFRIVLINETDGWREDIVAQTGKIWSAYLYDENCKVHIADLNPSYEMTYIDCAAENEISEEIRDVLIQDGDGGNASLIMYCHDVDRISWDRKYFCGQPSDPNAEDYASLIEAELEYYKSNSCIDLPRPPGVKMLLKAALQDCAAGDTNGAIMAMKAAIQAQQDSDLINQFTQALDALERNVLDDHPLASAAYAMIQILEQTGTPSHADERMSDAPMP